MLAESCHFLSVAPSDFISATLHHTLPVLFASCDIKVLEQIAKQTSKKVSSLFLNHTADVLAHIFLLQGPAPTNKALNFILQLLRNAADGASIDIQTLVKSCLVPLLAQLVVCMGDEDLTKVELVSFWLLSLYTCYIIMLF